MKLLLLDTDEEITRFRRNAENHACWAEYLARTARTYVEGQTTSEEWSRLALELGDIERDFDQMKGRLRLDRSILFNVYHRMLAIKSAWLEYQRRDFSREGALTPEGEEVLRAERVLFTDLMLKVKRMLVAAR